MQDYASSVLGVSVRVTRLNADGSTVTGASASYIQKAFIRAAFTPEYEEGDEITEKNAAGEVCVLYKAPDTLKQVNLEIAICNPDPEFTELISGGQLLSTAGQSVGYAAPLTGVDPNPNGSSLEIWSNAIINGKRAAVNPYWRFVFPFVKLRPSGERAVENGLMANTFEGYGVGNALWADGPQNDWPFPGTSDRAYQYARAASAPTVQGFQASI